MISVFPSEYFHFAKELSEYSSTVHSKGFVEANGGNLSIKIAPDLIMTTPTMMSKGALKTYDLVICNFSGDIVYGKRNPSSEIFSHIAVYRCNETVNAVIHTHPPYTCSFACSDEAFPMPFSPESIFWLGDIEHIHFSPPGSKELSKEIGEKARDKYVLILRNHGLLTWGSSLREALWRTEVMESHCRISHYIIERGGKCSSLSENEIKILKKMKENYLK
jgi:L-fuculose-phosphate aldolase